MSLFILELAFLAYFGVDFEYVLFRPAAAWAAVARDLHDALPCVHSKTLDSERGVGSFQPAEATPVL